MGPTPETDPRHGGRACRPCLDNARMDHNANHSTLLRHDRKTERRGCLRKDDPGIDHLFEWVSITAFEGSAAIAIGANCPRLGPQATPLSLEVSRIPFRDGVSGRGRDRYPWASESVDAGGRRGPRA